MVLYTNSLNGSILALYVSIKVELILRKNLKGKYSDDQYYLLLTY